MSLEVITVRALKDNYCYLVKRAGSPLAAVIDPSEAKPVAEALTELGLQLGLILNTHHHHDHVGGNQELARAFSAQVFCSSYDVARVPQASRGLDDGEELELDGLEIAVLAIPGHTQGQIAYYFRGASSLFVGDTLFAMGCGRLFEGTPGQMFASLQRIKRLPPATRLYFGHEYTLKNAAFALEVDPGNSAVAARLSDVERRLAAGEIPPAPTLQEELEVNPFLRAPDVASFARLRSRRDVF